MYASLPNFHKSDIFDAFCVAKVVKEAINNYPVLRMNRYFQILIIMCIYNPMRILLTSRYDCLEAATKYIKISRKITKIHKILSIYYFNL